MAHDDAPDERRNPPFLGRRTDDCEDAEVREFLSIAGWNIADGASIERHRLAWRYLLDQIDRTQKTRGRRAAIVVVLVSTLLSSIATFGLPLIWKWLLVRGG